METEINKSKMSVYVLYPGVMTTARGGASLGTGGGVYPGGLYHRNKEVKQRFIIFLKQNFPKTSESGHCCVEDNAVLGINNVLCT